MRPTIPTETAQSVPSLGSALRQLFQRDRGTDEPRDAFMTALVALMTSHRMPRFRIGFDVPNACPTHASVEMLVRNLSRRLDRVDPSLIEASLRTRGKVSVERIYIAGLMAP